MHRFYTLIILIICTPIFSSGASSAREYAPRQQSNIQKHRSTELLRNVLTPRTVIQSIASLETDQDFAAAQRMNILIGDALHTLPQLPNSAPASSSGIPYVPRLNLAKPTEKQMNLLKQAYRALSILDLVKKKYPLEPAVRDQLTITREHIQQLDPSCLHDPEGVPHSARTSSGRKRLWLELFKMPDPPTPPSPLSKETTDVSEPKSKDLQDTTVNKRLDLLAAQPADPDAHVPNFTKAIYTTIDKLEKKLSTAQSPKGNNQSPRFFAKPGQVHTLEHKTIYHEVLTSLLPLCAPLIELYFSDTSNSETAATKSAISTLYTMYQSIKAKGITCIISSNTTKALEHCAMIARGAITPRSKKQKEHELHLLYLNFSEKMLAIQRKQIPIEEDLLFAWAKELLTKTKRCDDLLRINMIISRNTLLANNPEIKTLMDLAQEKITHETQKEHISLSPSPRSSHTLHNSR